MKIVTIGAGCHAALTHGPALAALAGEIPEIELAAICDINPERARHFARQFSFHRVYTDYREMLAAEQPDGVVAITPAAITSQIGADVLRRGIPILLEKPPGRNRREYRQLMEAQQASRAPHLIAFNRRYMPLVNQARNLWRDYTGGDKLVNIRCDFYRHNRNDADFSTTAIHGIDLVSYLADADYREFAIHLQRNRSAECMAISLWGEMEGNVSVQLLFCPRSGSSFERIHLISEVNAMTLELPVLGSCDHPGRMLFYQRGQLIQEIPAEPSPWNAEPFYLGGFYHENLALIDMIRHRKPGSEYFDLIKAGTVVRVAELLSEAILGGQALQKDS